MRCLRKGSGPCLAVSGDNRYHAIMGAKRCFAVCPSDTAVALAALNARITIAGSGGERKLGVTDFFRALGNALRSDEMVKEITIPRLAGSKQTFIKFTVRSPVDFAIVSAASLITVNEGVCTDARIALGAVGPAPARAKGAEESLKGRPITRDGAEEAAEKALAGAKPLGKNAYKVEIAKTLVRRAILA
jgi:xanthine dehydrogenase YagS FAD-binding subunit